MAELRAGITARVLTFFIAILTLATIVLLLLHLQTTIEALASRHCPPETFISGPLHNLWVHWMLAPVALGPFFIVLTGIARIFPSIEYAGIPVIKSRLGLTLVLGSTAVLCVTYWVAASSLFCLSREQVSYRDFPWQSFEAVQWDDLIQIDVDCRSRGKSPDLYYVLTMKNGERLDIAGAEDFQNGFSNLNRQLVARLFKFEANVAPSCPDWYRRWVGKRPG